MIIEAALFLSLVVVAGALIVKAYECGRTFSTGLTSGRTTGRGRFNPFASWWALAACDRFP
jgi:hypothetical protein